MKRTNVLYILLLLLIISCPQTINFNENEEYFTETNKITYYKGSPFTGVVERYYDNGQLWVKTTYKDGKEDGPYESYYKNGQLRWKSTYKDGEYDGLFESYYENGQLRWKTTYKDGECISGDCL